MASGTGPAAASREMTVRRCWPGSARLASGRSAAARHPGHIAQPVVTRTAAARPAARTGTSASIPGCGSATPARPTGSSGDSATPSTAAMTPPAAPIAAARPRHAVISCPRLIPSARKVPYPVASRKLSRASSWPTMSSPMTPNSAASSHSATACGRIERWVFTDWADSSVASTSLPLRVLAQFPLHRGPVPAAVVEPQRYLDESVQRPVLAVEGGGAPGDIGAIPRLRREFGLRGIDAGDMEHERHRPAGRGGQHQPQRVARPAGGTAGPG